VADAWAGGIADTTNNRLILRAAATMTITATSSTLLT